MRPFVVRLLNKPNTKEIMFHSLSSPSERKFPLDLLCSSLVQTFRLMLVLVQSSYGYASQIASCLPSSCCCPQFLSAGADLLPSSAGTSAGLARRCVTC